MSFRIKTWRLLIISRNYFVRIKMQSIEILEVFRGPDVLPVKKSPDDLGRTYLTNRDTKSDEQT